MFKKKTLIIAAAGAVVAASSVPALAFENQFNGYFRLFGAVNNFNETPVTAGFFIPEGQDKKAPTSTYISQRARLKYTAKASDDLKLVTQFEIDSKTWGDASYTISRNRGSALGTDTINIETKHVYLDFNLPMVKGLNFKVGMQGVDDSFKGVVFGADMAGVRSELSRDKMTTSLGFYRWNDRNAPYGRNTRDLLAVDTTFKISDTFKIGGAYYYINDDRNAPDNYVINDLGKEQGDKNVIHTLGVNAERKLGDLTLNGFLVYQFGSLEEPVNRHVSAYAGNVGAKYQIGRGTVHSEFLYVSGEARDNGTSSAFQSVDDEHGYYDGNMILLFRDPYSMTIDNAVVYTTNNRDQGVIAGFIGYDHQCTSKLTTSVNAGFAAAAKNRQNRDSRYLGTEVNVQADYKLYDNLSVIARGAYVILGDYYKGVATNGTPDNPYMANLILNYTF